MATPDATALQRSDLNNFLFADIGTEANGMTLSVVSILAREGNDPWQEAGRLADLPSAAATNSLARTIASMPQSQWNLPDATAIAARLTGLLPTRPAKGVVRAVHFKAGWWTSARMAVALVCIALTVAYALAGMTQQTPAKPDGDAAAITAPAPGTAR